MPDIFVDIQKERISQNRKDLQEVGELFRQQVYGKSGQSDDTDDSRLSGDTSTRIKLRPIQLPDGKLKLMDIIIVMLNQLTRRDLVSVLMASLGISLMGMFTPYITMQFYDQMIPSGEDSMLLPLAALLISASIGAIMFSAAKSLVLLRIRDKMSAALQSALMERMYRMPTSLFKEYPAGKLGNMLMNICSVMQSLMFKMLSGGMASIFTVVYLFQIIIYAPDMLELSIIAFMLHITMISSFLILARKEQTRVRRATSEMSGFLYNMFGGIMKIKSSGAEERALNRWAHLFVETLTERRDRRLLLTLYPAISGLVALAITTAIYYYTVHYGLALSNYAAFMSSYGLMMSSIGAFSKLLPELIVLQPALSQCRPLLDTEPEKQDVKEKVGSLSGKIEINDLRFRYDDHSPYVINNLNLSVNAGEYVAIVGTSGCGKSTLLRLLLGFEKPESGSIFYDQHDITCVDIQSLRQHIGTCLQDGKVFGGTLYENITITNPSATQDDAWEAARLASFDKDIEELPMGMHTIVSEGGGGLSGGQCQRLLIARALVSKPGILFFDEATSSLDNITQRAVSDNLDRMHCTRIVIAHRLSTVKHCPRIIVLAGGTVVEEGNYDELMSMKGRFYELAKRQIME